MAEVGELLSRGMTEDYDHEPEHSTMAKELATKADISPPLKTEVPALPLAHHLLRPVFQRQRPP